MGPVGELIAKDSILRCRTVASRHSTRASVMDDVVTNTLRYIAALVQLRRHVTEKEVRLDKSATLEGTRIETNRDELLA